MQIIIYIENVLILLCYLTETLFTSMQNEMGYLTKKLDTQRVHFDQELAKFKEEVMGQLNSNKEEIIAEIRRRPTNPDNSNQLTDSVYKTVLEIGMDVLLKNQKKTLRHTGQLLVNY